MYAKLTTQHEEFQKQLEKVQRLEIELVRAIYALAQYTQAEVELLPDAPGDAATSPEERQ